MVGWTGCFGYFWSLCTMYSQYNICTEIKTPITMLGHWSHQAFISLLKRVGLLQLTAEQWRAVTYFSDFWLHWWILVTGAMGQSIVRVVDWGTTYLQCFALSHGTTRAIITILFCYSEYPNIYPSCPWLLSRLSICWVATVYLSSGDWLSSIPHCSPTHNLVLVLQ